VERSQLAISRMMGWLAPILHVRAIKSLAPRLRGHDRSRKYLQMGPRIVPPRLFSPAHLGEGFLGQTSFSPKLVWISDHWSTRVHLRVSFLAVRDHTLREACALHEGASGRLRGED